MISTVSKIGVSNAPSSRGVTRERLLDHAVAVVDEGGADALTMAHLAQRLGVRPPSLYKHVDSIDAVRRSVATEALTELTQTVLQATAGLSDRAALEGGCRAYLDYASHHPGRYAMIQRAPDRSDPLDAQLTNAGDMLVIVLLAVLRGYALQEEDAIHGVRIVRSSLHGFTMLCFGGGFKRSEPLERTRTALITALDAGLRALGPAGAAQ